VATEPRPPETRSRPPKVHLSWLIVVALLVGGSTVVVVQRHRREGAGTATAAERPSTTTPATTTPATTTPAPTTTPPIGTPPHSPAPPSRAVTTAPPSTAPPSTAPPSTAPPSTTAKPDGDGDGDGDGDDDDDGAAGAGGFFATPSVRRYLASRAGNVTAALIDLDTKTTALWRPGVEEDTASIVKVDILATLLRQDQRAGRTLPAEEQILATAMIEQSDNDAATDLWNDAGQETGIGAFNRLVPLESTTLGTDDYWGLTTTTAADQAKLVQAVTQTGKVLDAASRRYETGLMEQVEASERWGVSGSVPAGVTVALKNGWLPLESADWQINSIGWVDGRGRDYILAVLTNGDPSEGYGIQTIEGLSSLVWDHVAR
jgi:hypothetical protein